MRPGCRAACGGTRGHAGVRWTPIPVRSTNSCASCARSCGRFRYTLAAANGDPKVTSQIKSAPFSRFATASPAAQGKRKLLPFALDIPPPSPHRASQAMAGERRACPSAGMREFAPARRRREAQGTSRSESAVSGVCFFAYFLCTSKESKPLAEGEWNLLFVNARNKSQRRMHLVKSIRE